MLLEPQVKTYLAAVGAAAIYVSVHDVKPVSVGVARDLDRALTHLQQIMELPVSFGWIAWGQHYDALVAIAKIPDLMLRQRDDGIKVSKTLPEVVDRISNVAESSAIVLTPHKTAIARASVLAGYVERVFADLRTSGQLAAFNTAYKTYRQSAQRRGEKVAPYWAIETRLRRVTIQALAASSSRGLSKETMSALICQEFPWFKPVVLDHDRQRA
jgi:hypothetical protein